MCDSTLAIYCFIDDCIAVHLPVLLVHDDLIRPGRQRNLHHLLERHRVLDRLPGLRRPDTEHCTCQGRSGDCDSEPQLAQR